MNITADTIVLPDGRDLNYAQYGDPAGIPLLYCHGMPGSHIEARHASDAATRLGICLIAPDRAGYGYSDPVHSPSLLQGGADLVALTTALQLQEPAFIGFSGGSAYAMAAAVLLGQGVRRVVLAGSFSPFNNDAWLNGMSGPSRGLLECAAGSAERLAGAYAAMAADGHVLAEAMISGLSDAEQEKYRNTELGMELKESCALALRQGPRALFEDLSRLARPWGFDPSAIRCPVLLWHGMADRSAPPAMSEALAALIPGARLNLVPDAGHPFIFWNWETILRSCLDDLPAAQPP